MKINKKIVVPVLSTALGLSLIGGISGAIAWYQYNSKVSVSFVGTSVADTGVLQIGHKEGQDIKWGRDFYAEGEAAKLIPVTFGAMGNGNELPAQAYAYPESGCGEGYVGHNYNNHQFGGWQLAEEGKHYAQFDIYLRAYEADSSVQEGYKLVERDVFLSDVILKSVEDDKVAEEALRIHLDVENQGKLLLSKNARNELALFGGLDLDKNGHNDQYHKSLFNDDLKAYGVYEATDEIPEGKNVGDAKHDDGEEIVYGQKDQYQSTKSILELKQERDGNGYMPSNSDKVILRTSENGEVKVTVTIWLEGWEELEDGTNGSSNLWNPYYSAGTDIQLGLQFDSGKFREEQRYVMSFNANGGTGNMADMSCFAGSTFILPECAFVSPYAYQRFEGWSVNGEVKAVGASITPTGDTVISPVWKNAPEVSFDKNDNNASGSMDNVLAYDVSGYVLPDCAFTAPEGYEFAGWLVGAETNARQPGDKVAVSEDVTIKATWRLLKRAVSYNLNGSATEIASFEVDHGTSYDFLESTSIAAPEGKQFVCWKIAGSDVEYQYGDSVEITADTEIQAIWEPIPCEISFELNGSATVIANETVDYGTVYTLPAAPEAPSVDKEFKWWSVGGDHYAPGEEITITADTAIEAIWQNI